LPVKYRWIWGNRVFILSSLLILCKSGKRQYLPMISRRRFLVFAAVLSAIAGSRRAAQAGINRAVTPSAAPDLYLYKGWVLRGDDLRVQRAGD